MDPAASFLQHPIPSPPLAIGLGWMEVTIVILVVLLVFGNKLPGMARNLGRSFIEFKKGVKGEPAQGEETLPPANEKERIPREPGQKKGGA